jgi:DNA-binding IscR family transcriptional regulator
VFESPGLTDSHSAPELRSAWGKLKQSLEGAADGITFQQLVEESQERGKMYYI